MVHDHGAPCDCTCQIYNFCKMCYKPQWPKQHCFGESTKFTILFHLNMTMGGHIGHIGHDLFSIAILKMVYS